MVAYRWNNEERPSAQDPEQFDEDQGSTVFTFTLEPVPEGTERTLVEAGFEETPSDPAVDHGGPPPGLGQPSWTSWSPCSRAGS